MLRVFFVSAKELKERGFKFFKLLANSGFVQFAKILTQ